jgi:Domain of unknown function (DUF6766)
LNRPVKRFVRENSLTLVITAFFLFSLGGQIIAGWNTYNEDEEEHDQPAVGLTEYLTTPHFGEAVFENWESEFLQMGMFVLLTVYLRQKGSPESNSLDENEVDREPDPNRPGAPLPVRTGGVIGKVYEHSLGLALMALFVVSFGLHVVTGAAAASADEVEHGGSPISAVAYLATPRLWFESFQNWQSEFMSIAALTVLSIFLREKGSSESKPVDAPHAETDG